MSRTPRGGSEVREGHWIVNRENAQKLKKKKRTPRDLKMDFLSLSQSQVFHYNLGTAKFVFREAIIRSHFRGISSEFVQEAKDKATKQPTVILFQLWFKDRALYYQ